MVLSPKNKNGKGMLSLQIGQIRSFGHVNLEIPWRTFRVNYLIDRDWSSGQRSGIFYI